jgi:DNA-binding GntR family transcriptional regulator
MKSGQAAGGIRGGDKIGEKSGEGPGAGKKKELANETVYQALRSIIGNRRFEPGQRLNVEELARELGVSRTPVWEATRRLIQEGILRNIPNRGVFLVEHPWQGVRDIIEVRSCLDRLAAGLAVERIKRPILNKIARCLPEQLEALETNDIAGYYSSDITFHRLIAEASDNAYLKGLYESVTTHVFPPFFSVVALLPALYPVHEEIVAGLSNKDRERVDRAIVRHGELMIARLKEQMDSEEERMAMVRRIREETPRPGSGPKRRKPAH